MPEKISMAEPPETIYSGGHWFQFILSPFPGFRAVPVWVLLLPESDQPWI